MIPQINWCKRRSVRMPAGKHANQLSDRLSNLQNVDFGRRDGMHSRSQAWIAQKRQLSQGSKGDTKIIIAMHDWGRSRFETFLMEVKRLPSDMSLADADRSDK